jgi:hypothetical protein
MIDAVNRMECLNLEPKNAIALMMEAASTSEASVSFYQTTRRNNPEDRHPHTRRCEKQISLFSSGLRLNVCISLL